MADKKENLIEEEVKETKKATRKKKSDEDSAKSTAKKPRKGKEGAEAELTEEEKAQAIQEKFMEKCRGILAIAKKKKNVLDYKEIMNYFQDTDFEADKMEKVFEFLEACNVDVKMNDDEVEEDDILVVNTLVTELLPGTYISWKMISVSVYFLRYFSSSLL
jgi:RNA polymerase primary sigma factor